jgi:hypothetical protein
MNQPVTFPLIVWVDTAVCPGDHQLVLVTDGVTAYAYGNLTDSTEPSRDGMTVTVRCSQPWGPDSEPCDHRVDFDLTAERWITRYGDRHDLARYGTRLTVTVPPVGVPDVTEVDLSSAARYLTACEGAPGHALALGLWQSLTQLHRSAEALAYAKHAAETKGRITAHVPPM